VLRFSEYSSNKALRGELVCSSRESPRAIGCHGVMVFCAFVLYRPRNARLHKMPSDTGNVLRKSTKSKISYQGHEDVDVGNSDDPLSLASSPPRVALRKKRKTTEETRPSVSKKLRREGVHITRPLLLFVCASGLTRTNSRKRAASRSSNADRTWTPRIGTLHGRHHLCLHVFTRWTFIYCSGKIPDTTRSGLREYNSQRLRIERTLSQEPDLAGIISVERAS
jgi:hypothetical protein